MELRGVGPDGRPVKANVSDFAEKLRQGGESLSFGSSPTHAIYKSQRTGQTREVDLQEVAQASGIKNVQFHFDPKQARDSGLLVDRNVDQGVAYNLERIKRDEDKGQYLADKGYSNVYRNGDDFYAFENGKMYPINNKVGIDVSDFARMGAHAGRDVVATMAATAVVGGSAVAALPSGGTSLVAGVAAAGAAGAAGGVAGEAAQRGIDKLIGADADKYNSRLGFSEEARAMAGDAAMGAVGGAAGPLLKAGGGVVGENVVAPALKTFAGEWGANQAARIEANAALGRLPQGYMSKFATAEQASAQDAIEQGLKLNAAKTLSGEELSAVTAEAKGMLKPGANKPPLDAAEENFVQQGLRQRFQSETLEAAKAREMQKMMSEAERKINAEDMAAFVERQKANAHEVFAGNKKELETMFDPNSSIDTSIASQRKIINSQAEKYTRAKGLKLDRDAATGEVIGIESQSFRKYVEGQQNFVFDGAAEHLNSMRTADVFLNRPAPSGLQGDTIRKIRATVGQIDEKFDGGETATAVRELIEGIQNHNSGIKTSSTNLRETLEKFHKMSIDLADQYSVPKETRRALDTVNASLQKYEIGTTNAPDLVNSYYAGYNKLREVKSILGINRGAHNDEVFENLTRGLVEVAKTTGDRESVTTQQLVNTIHLDQILTGEQPSFRDLLTAEARSNFDALTFVKGFNHGDKEIVSGQADRLKRVGAGVATGLAAKATGTGSFTGGFIAGYMGGKELPSSLANAASSTLKKGGRAAAGALSTMAKLAGKTKEATVDKVTDRVAPSMLSTMVSEEQYADKLKRDRDRRRSQR